MPKRPRFSRWRRLPPVFRSGEHRPIGNENERDRIILYLPGRLLDLAEALAEKTGLPSLQDYCERLLGRAIETEAIDRKMSAFEARRGPLEGLKEIAEDPDYLAEWHERSGPNPQATRATAPITFIEPVPEPGPSRMPALAPPGAEERALVGPALPGADVSFAGPAIETEMIDEVNMPAPEPSEGPPGLEATVPEARSTGSDAARMRPEGPPARDASWPALLDVLNRHVGAGNDDLAFLPRLRLGAAPPDEKVAELLDALGRLEAAHEGAETIDRRVAHALHRLALESQVLLTDAWPGAFDDRTIAAIRAVQEAVERILSGQDIRYYPNTEPS